MHAELDDAASRRRPPTRARRRRGRATLLASTVFAAVAAVAASAAPVSATTYDEQPTSAVAYNLGGTVDGVYTDAAGDAFTGEGQTIVDLDGAFSATHPDIASKFSEGACFGSLSNGDGFGNLCDTEEIRVSDDPAVPDAYFVRGPVAMVPGNSPSNSCTEGGHLCHDFHGTATAGAALALPAVRHETDGRAHFSAGAAVGADLYPIKVGGGSGTTAGWSYDGLVAALDWVNEQIETQQLTHVAAVTMSVSGPKLAPGEECGAKGQKIDELAAELKNRHVAVVMTAGNDATPRRGAWNCGESIIRVGATDVSAPTLTSYTDRGEGVLLYAPVGDGAFAGDNKIMLPYKDHGWMFGTGTSFAAPQVAGAFAVLREKFGYSATVDELTALLQESGTPTSGADVAPGAAIIDIAAALDGVV